MNSVGESASSIPGGIVCGQVNARPPRPSLVSQSVTAISFSFEPAANFGEPAVIGWKLLWNSGNGYVFTTLAVIDDPASTGFTKSDNL